MIDQIAIRNALEAIRKASDSDLTISREAIGEIERQVGIIDALSNNREVKSEGQYLLSRALGRYAAVSGPDTSSVIWSARLHGAVARYEFALRRAGFLPPAVGGESQQPLQVPPKIG